MEASNRVECPHTLYYFSTDQRNVFGEQVVEVFESGVHLASGQVPHWLSPTLMSSLFQPLHTKLWFVKVTCHH